MRPTHTSAAIFAALTFTVGAANAASVAKWQRRSDAVEITSSDGTTITLTPRSALALRVQWTPLRPGKSEDWLIVPPEAPTSFDVKEASGELRITLGGVVIVTAMAALAPRATTPDGAAIADLPLTPGAPLRVTRHTSHAFFWEDEHDYVFAFAPTGRPLELLARTREATGAAPMPPKWVTGITQGAYGADKRALGDIVRKWRSLKLPLDAIWGDGGAFADRTLNDLSTTWSDGDLAAVREQHVVLGRWIMQSTKPGTKLDDALAAKQLLLTDGKGAPAEPFWSQIGGHGVDVFNPDARAAHKAAHAMNQGVNAGFGFFKVDYRDPRTGVTSRAIGAFDPAKGGDEGLGAAWRLLLSRATFEATRDLNGDGARGWVMTKYPVAGYQRFYCVWPDDHEQTLGVLANSVATMLRLGAAGMPWFNDDLGGFQDPPNKEQFIRWFQWGVFTPWTTLFGQEGRGSYDPAVVPARAPWMFDEETVAIYRRYASLRYRLVPYLYTYAHVAHATGQPITMALEVAAPDDKKRPEHPPLEYLYGDQILIAPITKEGSTSASVYLPDGTDWWDYTTGKRFVGGQTITRATPLDDFPVFVRAGAALPQAREGKQFVADGGLVDDEITWEIFPGNGTFALYEDDGKSRAYEQGAHAETTISVEERAPGKLVVTQSPTRGTFDGRPSRRVYWYRLRNVGAPAAVYAGANALTAAASKDAIAGAGWTYEAATRTLWVRAELATTDGLAISIDAGPVATPPSEPQAPSGGATAGASGGASAGAGPSPKHGASGCAFGGERPGAEALALVLAVAALALRRGRLAAAAALLIVACTTSSPPSSEAPRAGAPGDAGGTSGANAGSAAGGPGGRGGTRDAGAPDVRSSRPVVLLIGDSIASTGLGYAGFKDSEGALHERATILNPTTNLPETSPDTNAETSQNTLDHLAKWIGSSDPDVIHINTGLWEVKGVDEKDVPAIVARYKQNVARIFDQLQAMRPRATIVWATTTPVSDPNTKRRNSDIDAINAAAAEVTTARHVVVDDLHAFTIDNHLTHLAEGDGGTHFDEPSRRAQMRHVSEVILRVLPGAD